MIHDHIFERSFLHPGYEVCVDCGTYHSTQVVPREALYEDEYWGPKHGRSTMIDQVSNLTETNSTNISKIDTLLRHIEKPGWLIEIGAAPGIFLRKAIHKGCGVLGIEPDAKNISQIKKISGCDDIIHGYFPECMAGEQRKYDYIVAMDVLEHVEDYKGFVEGSFHLLRQGGKFMFMSPINCDRAQAREIDYCAKEHSWVFSREYLNGYLTGLFSSVVFEVWKPGHTAVICVK